jgi:hypothetical protein
MLQTFGLCSCEGVKLWPQILHIITCFLLFACVFTLQHQSETQLQLHAFARPGLTEQACTHMSVQLYVLFCISMHSDALLSTSCLSQHLNRSLVLN